MIQIGSFAFHLDCSKSIIESYLSVDKFSQNHIMIWDDFKTKRI